MNYQVYDSKIKKVVFESTTHIECLDYVLDNYDDEYIESYLTVK